MKLDRLLGIVTVLLNHDSVTAPYLAEKFEVSRRTISRDIQALCMAGIPVITKQGAGGGIEIQKGYKLDKSVLTGDELSGLIAAFKGLGTVSEKTSMEKTLLKLFGGDKVLSLREPVVIDLASHYKGSLTGKIELIKKAVMESRLIGFNYYNEKGLSHRVIEPAFVIFQWAAWYVFGYCREKQAFRLFKLTRLLALQMLEETFDPRPIPENETDFNARFTDNKTLIADFDPQVQYLLIDAYGPDCYTRQPDGKLRARIGYTNEDYILSWVLSYGDKAAVLAPETLREKIKRALADMQALYK